MVRCEGQKFDSQIFPARRPLRIARGTRLRDSQLKNSPPDCFS